MLYLRCRCGSLKIRTLFQLHKPKLYNHESLHFPSKLCPSLSKAQTQSVCSTKIISARSMLLLIIVILLSVPATLTQKAAIDLTAVVLVNSANNGRSDYVGYHHNVRPEVGLLTSTARTFIQEGVTTEYATQVVGTTLDSGRLYAQFLKKSSRVLYNNGHKQQESQQAVVSPTVVTSWVGDNLQLQSKSLLESHNDLFNADLPDWQDIDDRLLHDDGNIFVGNTDFAHLSEARNKKQQEPLINDEKKVSNLIIATLLSQNLTGVARNNTPKHLFSLHTVGNAGNQNQEFARILDVNKVMPIGDLATYTVRNPFSPSGLTAETIIEHSELTQDNAVNNYKNNDNKLSRSPKQYYLKQMDPNGSGSSLRNAPEPLFNSQLSTITYYGFADFTTVVGESVIVFSPSSVTQNTNLGRVTSIKGEATLGGVSDNEQETTIGAINVAMEFEVVPTKQISSLPNWQLMDLNSNMIQSVNFVDISSEISREEAEGILQTLTTDVNDKELSLKKIKLVTPSIENIKISYFTDKLLSVSDNTFKTYENMLGSTTAYSRPSDDEVAEIYASLSRVAASRESISSTMQTIAPLYIIDNSLLLKLPENTNEQSITRTVELVSKSVEALQSSESHHTTTAIFEITPTNTSSELQTLGGATTIFYEDDPFANFVEPVVSAIKATDILNLTDIKITTQPEYGTSTLSNIKTTSGENEDSVETTTVVPKILANITSDEYEVEKSSSSSSIDASQSVLNVSEVSQNDTKIDVQEMNTDDDIVQLRDCIRTSQTFLTQIAKTITQLNTLRESVLPGEDEAIKYSTIETVFLPTFDILETTKFYCIKPQTAAVGATSFAIGEISEIANDGVRLEKPGLDNIDTATLTENMDGVSDGLDDDDTDYITTISANIIERDLIEYTTPDPVDSDNNNETDVNNQSDSDINFNQSIYAVEDDSGEEIELIYKTLYTTYTYLTTFFNDDSSNSISSHTEVFTNIITSTLESDIDEIEPISTTKEILNTENAFKLSTRDSSNNGNKVSSSSKFVLPTELGTILRVGEHDIDIDKTGDASDAHTATMFLDDSKIMKTYFTTYTYYTTVFVEGETEIMSRTEVYTNYVTDAVTSTTVFEIDKQSRINSDNIASSAEKLSKLNQDTGANNIDTDTKRQRNDTIRAHASILFHDDHLGFSNYTLVTDIRSSSSNGKKHIINQNQEAFFDQISSESNTDEIRPSAVLLLQTSFTTFTYYTTMYSNNETNVISRLETATDVVTETLQPTKTSSVDEVTLPITYFTTFTYWTKLAKNGEITTLSREETVSNIVTPSTISSTPITADVQLSNGNIFQGEQPKTEISNTDQLDKITTVNSTNIVHNSVRNSSVDNEITRAAFEPTTYYTTYTYYTTSYNGDRTTTDSRFETITHVVPPTNIADKTIEVAAGERNIVSSANLVTDILSLAVNNDVTPTLEKSPNTLLYDHKRIIDAGGVSTLYYRTEILATTAIDGMQSNFTSSTSSLHVDEFKQALFASSMIANSDISSVRQYKTGLVRLIEGTRIGNHTTTLYQSKVIGTFIENRYAQIIESTSSFIFETNNNMITTDGSIKPSLTLQSTNQIEATVALTLQNSIVDNASHSTAANEYTKEDEENFDVEDDDEDVADGKINKERLSYQSKKHTFTPIIRPFTSRNRPQFAPKKKNGVTSSATIITRHDFTPTITATPALKSSGRFSTRKGVFTGITITTGASAAIPNSSSSRRTFGRPIKSLSSTGSVSTSNTPAILSASGFSVGRNRLTSSTRLQSSTRRAGVLVRPSSVSSNRQGFSSTYASNSRLRIKSTSLTQAGQQNTPSTESLPILTSETSGEESTTPEFQASFDENDEGSTDAARRSQNPLLRLRRPLNRPSGFISASQRVVNGANSISSIGAVSQRRNPLTLRAKTTTLTSATTTTQTPRARSLERPKFNNALGRTRPQNSLFPPRGLLQRQANQETKEAKENKKADSTEGNVDIDDDFEYDDEDEEDNEDDAEGDSNRRRRSNIKQHKFSTGVEKSSKTYNYKIKYLSTRSKSIRVRREAETPLQRRSSFRNRFRRPKLTASATTAEDQNYNEDIEPETPPFLTTAVTRSRTSGRFAPRYGLQHASTQAVTAPATTTSTGNHYAIRPTRPSNGRAQFTLREKDTTTTTQKGLTRPGTSHFRRPQTAASSRRSSSPTISNRRKTYNNNSNLSQDAVARSTSSRVRTNLSRTRTTVRGRSRNDYNVDTVVLPYDGTITITHVIPAEVTIPVINGKITEYKNVVTAKTSTEILSPQQYTTFLGSNGQTMLALTREDSSVNFGGVTEVTQYVLHESPTTTVIFTPTTIRGRKTSFSHVIPSTVYSVENVISTTQPQISPNAPLANILLSQLLLGNIGLPPANPLLGALGAAATPAPIQLGVGSLVPQLPPIPVTEYRTHTSTYVTTVFEGMSTVLPVTFQGKKILTTVYDTTAQTITATEFVTDTIVTTPTQQTHSAPQVNSLLIQQLLLQQQLQPHIEQPQLPILHSTVPNLLLSDNLQELDTNHIRLPKENDNDIAVNEDYTQNNKTSRKKSRKSSKGHKRKHQSFQDEVPERSSIITLYVSGRRPGEFSTILSTVPLGSDSTIHKRQAPGDLQQTSKIYTIHDFYASDGSEYVSTYLMPQLKDDKMKKQIELNLLESGGPHLVDQQTQSLESIVGDVDTWIAKSTHSFENAVTLEKQLVPTMPLQSRDAQITESIYLKQRSNVTGHKKIKIIF
ncbi:uncharacterized protein LOC126765903 [Bactrocera neohumeralis]|uniref:uncharacterized protein LOC126765903 n=1 Tax=Bactrocera neohumeralis TaxID=98809 RepID=UPI002164F3C9|nr:uncharacterized protein LOC126765903 [Bactrocera neohumeralis]XP_050339528.1 uncharacterized protein LOC126765903 [Bactrocera neohumeralis]